MKFKMISMPLLAVTLVATLALWYSGADCGDNPVQQDADYNSAKAAQDVMYADAGEADTGEGGPKIFFPETSFDFGTVSQDSKVTHTFIVRNTGDAPLKLIKAKGS